MVREDFQTRSGAYTALASGKAVQTRPAGLDLGLLLECELADEIPDLLCF